MMSQLNVFGNLWRRPQPEFFEAPTRAFAGPTEPALLAKYEGTWKGTVSGPNPGTVVRRLTFKTATIGQLNYSGRCSFGAAPASTAP